MTPQENLFILITLAVLVVLAIWKKNIPWEKLGFAPKPLFNGWWQVLLFSSIIFVLVQLTLANDLVDFPVSIVDKDPLIPLLIIVFLQELIFRGLLITWLERWGYQKALWISTIVFGLIHLVHPCSLFFAGLTLIGGYFLGWHFLKFRNIYLLVILHLIVNLSFNYALFQAIF